jgi:hypothetical protein
MPRRDNGLKRGRRGGFLSAEPEHDGYHGHHGEGHQYQHEGLLQNAVHVLDEQDRISHGAEAQVAIVTAAQFQAGRGDQVFDDTSPARPVGSLGSALGASVRHKSTSLSV